MVVKLVVLVALITISSRAIIYIYILIFVRPFSCFYKLDLPDLVGTVGGEREREIKRVDDNAALCD